MYKKTFPIILASVMTACTINVSSPGGTDIPQPGGITPPAGGSTTPAGTTPPAGTTAPGGGTTTPGTGAGASLPQSLFASEPSRDIDGRPTVEHRGTIKADETWGPDKVHVIKGELYIQGDNSPTVTILPGTVVRIGNGGAIWVGYNGRGGLVAKGTADQPIRITSDAPTPAHGDWKTIGFYKGNLSAVSVIDHAIVEYGGHADYGNVYLYQTTLKLANSEIRHSSSHGLKGENDGHLDGFVGSSLHGNKKAPIAWTAAAAHELGADSNYQGNDIDRVYLKAGTLAQSATWQALNVPYQLNGEFYVQGAASPVLSLQPGVQLLMGDAAAIWVGYNGRGGLEANGTADAPITITSDAPTPSAGDWKTIGFYKGAIASSQLVHTNIAYGGSKDYGMVHVSTDGQLALKQASLKHSRGVGLKVLKGARVTTDGVTYEGNQDGDEVNAN